MTGRDLIVYIMTHHLEDEPIIKDGKFIGTMTVEEAAKKLNVGAATVFALMNQGVLEGFICGDSICVLAAPDLASKGGNNEQAKN